MGVQPMRWFKRDMWKTGIAYAGILIFLILVLWIQVSTSHAYEGASGSATPGALTVQTTPTEDETVTALNKEKLTQEVQQLKSQNEPDLFSWLRTNAAILISTLVVVIGGLIGLFRWFGDRRSEREKRAEERFQSAVIGLGDEKEGARIGAAILLRTFLRPGYEEFYIQTFDLAVANLRLPRTPDAPEDPDTPLPLTTLSQALIVVFKEAFPLSRSQNKGGRSSLDASGIQLDNAFLHKADLVGIFMPQSCLRGANLNRANLTNAILENSDLRGAYLGGANLHGAYLGGANLTNSRGLTKEQLIACKAKGAIIDEVSTAHPSHPAIASPPLVQSNYEQPQSSKPAQVSMPISDDTGDNSAASSQQVPES
jgi:hypothetical protein